MRRPLQRQKGSEKAFSLITVRQRSYGFVDQFKYRQYRSQRWYRQQIDTSGMGSIEKFVAQSGVISLQPTKNICSFPHEGTKATFISKKNTVAALAL